MSDEAERQIQSERADQMRALPQDARLAAIDAADNVVGFDRISHRNKQVALRSAYRKPK